MLAPSRGNFSSSHRRRRSSHHHGRSGRNRRKKLWSHFSRWNADVSDDESDFLNFCRSRGLSRIHSAPVEKLKSNGANKAPSGGGSAKENESNPLTEESSKYISLLCSFLKDKNKFIEESRSRTNDASTTSNANSNVNEKEETTAAIEKNGDNCLVATDDTHTSTNIDQSQESEAVLKLERAPKFTGTFFRRSYEKKKASLPRISPRGEDAKSKNTADDEVKSTKHDAVVKSQLVDVAALVTSPRRLSREWNAKVEQDIMRLYESGDPGATLSFLDPQPQLFRLNNVKDQVDAKLSNSEQTPSYVLALANLFRKRMQIRKEFSEVSGQVDDVDLKGSSMLPTKTSNSGFPQKSHKTLISKSAAGDDCSGVALRYHHVTKEGGIYISHHNPSMDQKSRSIIRGTVMPPSVQSIAKPSEIILDNTDFKETADLSNNPSKNKNFKEVNKNDPTMLVSQQPLPLPNLKDTFAKIENLEELLTVFPKAPQFKFAGIQQIHQSREGFVASRHKAKQNNSNLPESAPLGNGRRHHSSNDVLTASVVGALRRNARNNGVVDNKVNKKHCDKTVRFGPTDTNARHCFSATQPIQRDSKWLSVSAEPATSLLVSRQNKATASTVTSSSNFVALEEQTKPDDVTFALVSEQKVRWPGSLGSLYKKNSNDATCLQMNKQPHEFHLPMHEADSFTAALSANIDRKNQEGQNMFSPPTTDMLKSPSLEKAFAV